jgi:hypothetical protein
LWERVKRLLDYLDEMFALHPSPSEIRARSLRVAVIVLVVIVIFRAVAFVFFFLVWLLSNEDIGSYPAITRV